MSDVPILYELDGGLACIILNRPQVLNSFTPEMLAALHAAVSRAGREARAVLITGAGRGFSAGQDLASIQAGYTETTSPDLKTLLEVSYHPMLADLRALPMPVVAAVNGVAAGAGLSLALACDLRVAAENARFATAFTRIGLVPDAGMGYTLPRLVGAGRAASLLLTGEQVDAPTALSIGLVDKLMPAASFAEEARAYARTLAEGPTRAFALTKRMLQADGLSFSEMLTLEAELQAEAGNTADHRGAIAAFLRKEPARFAGR
ncbi:MAG: enoyl-CoA hydratase-related protein [Dehalococcoidia bacterium]